MCRWFCGLVRYENLSYIEFNNLLMLELLNEQNSVTNSTNYYRRFRDIRQK